MSFAVVMITVDRVPRRNFLAETLANLKRSGVFDSPLLESFSIVNSNFDTKDFIYEAIGDLPISVYSPIGGMRKATENGAMALAIGSESQADWVLFLEDDIDVIDKFLESTDLWLARHGRRSVVFPLGANYADIAALYRLGADDAWTYELGMFYGTLAFALTPGHAKAVSDYWYANRRDQTYDLLMSRWAREQKVEHFVTPVPSFVQHIGRESAIRPGSPFIQYESWPGRRWRYEPKSVFMERD